MKSCGGVELYHSEPWHQMKVSGKLASHRGGPGSIPGLVKWDLWWTKWRRGRFSPSTSVSPCHSFHQILHPHHDPGQVQYASKWPTCRVDTVWTPLPTMQIKKKSFVLRPLFPSPEEIPPGAHCIGDWMTSRACLDAMKHTESSCFCRESKPGCPARSLVAIPTELFKF
jgi:hypothetical protein